MLRLPLVALAALALPLTLALLACGPGDPSPGEPPPVPTTAAPPPVAATASPPPPVSAAPPTAPPVTGEALYARYCGLCHGRDAKGYAADNAPSLVSSTFLGTATDLFLRQSIERGRPGTAMAGFGRSVGGPLPPEEVDLVIAYLRGLAPTPKIEMRGFVSGGDPENGRKVFAKMCQTCHGTPTQRSNAVHLANPLFLEMASDAFIRYAIVEGRPGTPMLPFVGLIDGKGTNDLVAYIRSLVGQVPAPSSLAPPPSAMPPGAPSSGAPVPEWTSIPLNPKGGAPRFNLRADRFVPMAEVKKALDDKKRIIIVDARPPSDWLSMHITGSVPLPYYDLKLVDRIPNDGTWVIAYCGCPHHASGEVVDELKRRGYKNAAVLDEGLFAWQKAGYPLVQAPGMSGLAAPPPHDPHHGHNHGPHGHDPHQGHNHGPQPGAHDPHQGHNHGPKPGHEGHGHP